MIYLDNAATTLHKPKSVKEAIIRALDTCGNSGRGATDTALTASRNIYKCRTIIAKLFNLNNPKNIAFTMNSTEALNMAIYGSLKKGDHVISTELEHNSVLRPLFYMQSKGVSLDFVKADKMGNIDYSEFERLINPKTKAIICTHASNLTGTLIDIKKVGEIAKMHNLRFIVDASQTAGVFPIDIQDMNIDILCFTGHKSLFGPQGTGGICLRDENMLPQFKRGGSGVLSYEREHPSFMPIRLEAGTLNSHGISGLLAGVEFILETGIDKIREKEEFLLKRLYSGLSKIDGVKIYGDFRSFNRCPVISINIRDYDSSIVSEALIDEYEIATRPGAHCAPLLHKALGTVSQGAVRFSISYFNTEEEIDMAIKAIRELASEN